MLEKSTNMSIGEKIREKIEENGTSLSWVAKQIGMSRAGFNTMLETDSIKVSTLKKIAELFKVPIDYFFSDKIEELQDRLLYSGIAYKHMSRDMLFYTLASHATVELLQDIINKGEPVDINELQEFVNKTKASLQLHRDLTLKGLSKEDRDELVTLQNKMNAVVESKDFNENSFTDIMRPFLEKNMPKFGAKDK